MNARSLVFLLPNDYHLDAPLFFDLHRVKKQPELTANRKCFMRGLRSMNR